MVAPLYVTVECVEGEAFVTCTVNCLVCTPKRRSQGYYLDDCEITENSYKRVLAALAWVNAKNHGIEAAEFVVEF